MKIGLVGYGRMGKAIEKIALQRGHKIIYKVDTLSGVGDTQQLTLEMAQEADSIIEFALPQNMDHNVSLYSESKTPVVVGTTGWAEKLNHYKEMIETNSGTFIWGSNYSLGAHILFKLTSAASKMINQIEDYDIMVNEFHHKNKIDSPSGTALTIAKKILENCERKKEIQTEQLQRAIKPEELHVTAVRGGSIPGIHSVIIDSESDIIEIKHEARNRGVFALGAVLAAEWIIHQESGFYSVEDFIDQLF